MQPGRWFAALRLTRTYSRTTNPVPLAFWPRRPNATQHRPTGDRRGKVPRGDEPVCIRQAASLQRYVPAGPEKPHKDTQRARESYTVQCGGRSCSARSRAQVGYKGLVKQEKQDRKKKKRVQGKGPRNVGRDRGRGLRSAHAMTQPRHHHGSSQDPPPASFSHFLVLHMQPTATCAKPSGKKLYFFWVDYTGPSQLRA